MSFQNHSHFHQTSKFERIESPTYDEFVRNLVQAKQPSVELSKEQCEDWVYRLEKAANEAYDEHLAFLESDLLDLRDELMRLKESK